MDGLTRYECEMLVALLTKDKGAPPVWEHSSLLRCHEAGLVDEKGVCLTRDGRRKAGRVQEVSAMLYGGAPLELPRTDVASNLPPCPWFRSRFVNDNYCTYGPHVLFAGKVPEGLVVQSCSCDDTRLRAINRIVAAAVKKGGDLLKMEPYALQQMHIRGLETVCLRRWVGGARSGVVRIQARYYYHIIATWPGATFWHSGKRDATPIYVKGIEPRGLGNGFVAAVLPVDARNWDVPVID